MTTADRFLDCGCSQLSQTEVQCSPFPLILIAKFFIGILAKNRLHSHSFLIKIFSPEF